MSVLKALWRGHVPLGVAFWRYAIFWGLLVNLAAALAAGAFAVVGNASAGQPGLFALAAIAAHLLPIPYNVLVLVGVWRSAGNSPDTPFTATAARTFVTLWAALLTLL